VPAVLHFERVDTRKNLDFSSLPSDIDDSILCHDTSISLYDIYTYQLHEGYATDHFNSNRNPALVKHELLSKEELPRAGTLVAIDAEFVSMQQVCVCLSRVLTLHLPFHVGRD